MCLGRLQTKIHTNSEHLIENNIRFNRRGLQAEERVNVHGISEFQVEFSDTRMLQREMCHFGPAWVKLKTGKTALTDRGLQNNALSFDFTEFHANKTVSCGTIDSGVLRGAIGTCPPHLCRSF